MKSRGIWMSIPRGIISRKANIMVTASMQLITIRMPPIRYAHLGGRLMALDSFPKNCCKVDSLVTWHMDFKCGPCYLPPLHKYAFGKLEVQSYSIFD